MQGYWPDFILDFWVCFEIRDFCEIWKKAGGWSNILKCINAWSYNNSRYKMSFTPFEVHKSMTILHIYFFNYRKTIKVFPNVLKIFYYFPEGSCWTFSVSLSPILFNIKEVIKSSVNASFSIYELTNWHLILVVKSLSKKDNQT